MSTVQNIGASAQSQTHFIMSSWTDKLSNLVYNVYTNFMILYLISLQERQVHMWKEEKETTPSTQWFGHVNKSEGSTEILSDIPQTPDVRVLRAPAAITATRPGPEDGVWLQGGECDPGAAPHWSPAPYAGLPLVNRDRGNRPSRLLTRGPARPAFLFSVTFLGTGFRLLVSVEPIGGAFHWCQARKC